MPARSARQEPVRRGGEQAGAAGRIVGDKRRELFGGGRSELRKQLSRRRRHSGTIVLNPGMVLTPKFWGDDSTADAAVNPASNFFKPYYFLFEIILRENGLRASGNKDILTHLG